MENENIERVVEKLAIDYVYSLTEFEDKKIEIIKKELNEENAYALILSNIKKQDNVYYLDSNENIIYKPVLGKKSVQKLIEAIKNKYDFPTKQFTIFEIDAEIKNKFPKRLSEFVSGKENIVYELKQGFFVRELYLCDVIKNWDFEDF
jgi:hypothetical protein